MEYDWVNYGTTTGTTPLRTTEYDYYFPAPEIPQNPSGTESVYGYWREHHASYWSDDEDPRRLNAVQRVTVSESGSNPVAITEFEYDDEYGTGNVTAEEYWDSELAGTPPSLGSLSATNSQVITTTYNGLGQVTEIDGDAVNTEIAYGTIPGGSGPGPYPTQVVYAPGTAIARTFSYVWDYGTGFLDTETDEDNDIDTEYTYDGLGRILTVGEDGVRSTETSYDDDDRLVRVESDLLTLGDGKLQSVTHYDPLGRVVLTRVTDGAALSTSPTATDGIKVSTTYIPASGGNRVVTSTPYRTTSDPTLEWSCTQYDLLGRVVSSAMFKGYAEPDDCADEPNRTGIAYVTHDADRTETTDPAGKVREEYRDGLGRLVTVTEDPGGSLDSDTDYTYDPLGNLLTVDQGTQTRTFGYSSLGRLLGAVNPENGEITYTYNPDGSLDTVTDARSIEISYTYDVLGRITAKNYTDSTPDVTYSYHTSGAPKIGALQSVASSVATETFTSYDSLGRVLAHTQEIAGNSNDYTLGYTYRLDDSVATIEYPSGRIVGYEADNAGRVREVSEGSTVYADLDNATGDYDPLGRMARIELGNGLWEARDYRPAGTATALKLGTSSGGSERLGLQYDYSATANNGNLSSHVITHPGPVTYTQSFTYDAVKPAGDRFRDDRLQPDLRLRRVREPVGCLLQRRLSLRLPRADVLVEFQHVDQPAQRRELDLRQRREPDVFRAVRADVRCRKPAHRGRERLERQRLLRLRRGRTKSREVLDAQRRVGSPDLLHLRHRRAPRGRVLGRRSRRSGTGVRFHRPSRQRPGRDRRRRKRRRMLRLPAIRENADDIGQRPVVGRLLPVESRRLHERPGGEIHRPAAGRDSARLLHRPVLLGRAGSIVQIPDRRRPAHRLLDTVFPDR